MKHSGRSAVTLRTAAEQQETEQSRSDVAGARRSDILNGRTREERTFILEKLAGLNDKDAALAAGFTLSMAENTKQKIWSRPGLREEFEQLQEALGMQVRLALLAKLRKETQSDPEPIAGNGSRPLDRFRDDYSATMTFSGSGAHSGGANSKNPA